MFAIKEINICLNDFLAAVSYCIFLIHSLLNSYPPVISKPRPKKFKIHNSVST